MNVRAVPDNTKPWPVAPKGAAAAVDPIVLQIVEGTNQIQRNIIANAVLGRSARR